MNRTRLYRRMLPIIVACGRECGYAIGLHGSMQNDLDLIAAPWTEQAVAGLALAEEIARRLGALLAAASVRAPSKPHGRTAFTIVFMRGDTPTGRKPLYIDLSVMPRLRERKVLQVRP